MDALKKMKMALRSILIFWVGLVIGMFLMFYGDRLAPTPFAITSGLFGLFVVLGTWYLVKAAKEIKFVANEEFEEIKENLLCLRNPLPAECLSNFLLASGAVEGGDVPLLGMPSLSSLTEDASERRIAIRLKAMRGILAEITDEKRRRRLHSDKKRDLIISSLLTRIRSGILLHPEVVKELAAFVALIHSEGSPNVLSKIAEAITALIVSIRKAPLSSSTATESDRLLGMANRAGSTIPFRMERSAREADSKVTASQCPFGLELISSEKVLDFAWALTSIALRKAPVVKLAIIQAVSEFQEVLSSKELHPQLLCVKEEIIRVLDFVGSISSLGLSSSLHFLARDLGLDGASAEIVDGASFGIDVGHVVLLTILLDVTDENREAVELLITRTAIAYPFLPLILAKGNLNTSHSQSIREDHLPEVLFLWQRDELRSWFLTGRDSSKLWGGKVRHLVLIA